MIREDNSYFLFCMRQSQLFTKTLKHAPKDEVSKNAQLLIRAGFVHKEMAGVYAFLPLGLRVLEHIKSIVREEMDALGCQELIMTSLQRKELWQKTDRWDDEKVDVWFKSMFKNGAEVGFGWSHEEQITEMMKNYLSSYRDLPANVYQFQTKLRNETRAKSGIMRCREFVMKDLYSYSRTEEHHQKFYDSVTKAYLRVFERVGLGDRTFLTFASGGAFTQFSHEFQTITDAGEDIVYLDREKGVAINEEVLTDEVIAQLGVNRENLEKIKTAEVGNIFSFGGTKSEQLGLYFKDDDGVMKPVVLGSYGIGITRLMGVIAECFSDEKGLVWPESVAPFQVHLLSLGQNEKADEIYRSLTEAGFEVLYDDRDVTPGEKFAESDLFGIPYRMVIGKRSLESGAAEVKRRIESEAIPVAFEHLISFLKEHLHVSA